MALVVLLGQTSAPRVSGGPPQRAATRLPISADALVPMRPGWYYVERSGYAYTFHVPAGFLSAPNGDVIADSGPSSPGLAFVGDPGFVYADACHWTTSSQAPTGESAAQFVAALAADIQMHPLALPDTVVAGRPAKQIRIGTRDTLFDACDDQSARSYEGRSYQSQWIVDDLTAIDLGNGDRGVVLVSYLAESPQYWYDQLTYIVNSVRIEPAPS